VTDSLPPVAELKRAVAKAWPGTSARELRVHGEGWTHLVLEGEGQRWFRIPRFPQSRDSLTFEARLLEFLSSRLSVPVPRPYGVAYLANPPGWPFLAYRGVPGIPLSEVGSVGRAAHERLARLVGTLLRELAELPERPLLRRGVAPGGPRAWEEEYRQLWFRYDRFASTRVPAPLHRSVTQAFEHFFCDLRGTRYRAVATHRDLSADHILWDLRSNRPTGVIDWEDFRMGDPAFDLTGLTGLGRRTLAKFAQLRRDPGDSSFGRRLVFYRRIVPLHGVLYAIEHRKARLLRKSIRDLQANL
jgi:aminoglycoside 2''-phosphotransferase